MLKVVRTQNLLYVFLFSKRCIIPLEKFPARLVNAPKNVPVDTRLLPLKTSQSFRLWSYYTIHKTALQYYFISDFLYARPGCREKKNTNYANRYTMKYI